MKLAFVGPIVTASVIANLAACGSRSAESRDPQGRPDVDANQGDASGDSYILRGQWLVEIASSGTKVVSLREVGHGTSSQPIQGTVAAAVQFQVSGASFVTPSPVGQASYGSLNVTKLSDNALKVCGSAQNQKCTEGVIRIYSSGTPGAGLWNSDENYGLPITTSGNTVGLNAAGAATAAKVAITSSTRVLKLSEFTSAPELKIPVSVDFSNAAAGSYSSTLVVEYVVR